MANNKLSELTFQKLQSKKNKLKPAVIGLGIVMVVACSILIWLAIVNKKYSLIAMAIGCSITMVPSIIVWNQLNKEIKSRS